MRTITLEEFESNIDEYIDLSQKEDISITKDNKPYLTLSKDSPNSWEDFFTKWANVQKHDVDLNDPRIAGILKI